MTIDPDRASTIGEMSTKPKVLLAMSGGVDSSVAAGLLLRQGYEVVGAFMRLGSPGETLEEAERGDSTPTRLHKQGCCSVGDAMDARRVAAELDIPLYVLNFKRDFRRVIDYFVASYASGTTPNPCVRCNDWLKFGKLHEQARLIGADCVASGHYARIREHAGAPALFRGIDSAKDQSYVLFGIPSAQLGTTLLPIGEIESKQRVRELAHAFGLPVFDKPDSQEICFVPDDDYASLVERERPELKDHSGDILDTSGKVVGRHHGQHRLTIGQRRKVGVALGHPIYVVDKDPVANTVTVGSAADLESVGCEADEANWLVRPQVSGWAPCLARHRYNGEAVEAEYRCDSDDGAKGFRVRFGSAQRAVTPGQAIVLYSADEPDLVLGGGWITKVERSPLSESR